MGSPGVKIKLQSEVQVKLQSGVPSVRLEPHQSQEQADEAGRSTATSAFLHTPQVGRETRHTLPDN